MGTLASRIPNVNDLLAMPTEYLAREILVLARQSPQPEAVDMGSFLREGSGTGAGRHFVFVYADQEAAVNKAFDASIRWLRKELFIVDAGERNGRVLITHLGNDFLTRLVQ